MSETRIPYDPPVRGGTHCTNCLGEIQANARLIGSLEIVGLNGYEWTHVETGSRDCPPLIRQARPYSDWDATKQVEAALKARWAAEDAAIDAEEVSQL
jgi:hypothetical protein